ncbi:E3 ubiquitin-protein ligase RNF13 [Papilio xuthus]|uniref:E3 ubiquitin-protein ligase RNF13 n=1 Tax=Papilio xuthus TaxID=66420 RepID=A0A194PJL5_PAPXU|nr:E3 ubiquitin-protein ligase RNF13 [Papilio xuthus]
MQQQNLVTTAISRLKRSTAKSLQNSRPCSIAGLWHRREHKRRDVAPCWRRWGCTNMLRAIVACLLALLTKATANVYVYTVDTPHTIFTGDCQFLEDCWAFLSLSWVERFISCQHISTVPKCTTTKPQFKIGYSFVGPGSVLPAQSEACRKVQNEVPYFVFLSPFTQLGACPRQRIAQEFPDMPATFGGEVPLTGLRGLLVQGEPEDGCSALPPPPQVTDNFTGKWIVLLARFNCSFEIKIRNAQAAGYDCAIVHNVNSSELETMSAKNPDGIVIPSTFVSDKTGEVLIEAYLYTFGNYYIMLDGISPYNINSLLVPFAVVVVLCLIVILIFMIIKCIKDRRRARRHRLPNRFLKKIPTCKFSKGDPYDTCAICLDDYQEGERLRVLPCAHAYHSKCIDPWLTQNRRVCPVCKRRVLAAGEPRARSDSDSDTEPLLADSDRAPTQASTAIKQ